jgi:hypothetical protein
MVLRFYFSFSEKVGAKKHKSLFDSLLESFGLKQSTVYVPKKGQRDWLASGF